MAMAPPVHILTLSSESPLELDSLIEKYKNYLHEEGKTLNLSDLAYSTNTSAHHSYRVAVVGRSCKDIANNLEKLRFERGMVQDQPPKLCFLFSGSGNGYHRMGQGLYDTIPQFKKEFDKWSSFIQKNMAISLHDVIFGENSSMIEPPFAQHMSCEITQYLVNCLWTFWGIKPDSVLGHSLGEYAAAPASGMMHIEDSIKIAASCSLDGGVELVSPGRMAVVFSEKKTLENLVAQCKSLLSGESNELWLSVAGENSQSQHVVAGCPDAISKFMELCKNNKIRAVLLRVAEAYHSQGVDPYAERMLAVGNKFTYNQPVCKYISSLTGGVLEVMTGDYWSAHLSHPFKFSDACRTAYEDCRARVFIEMGGRPIVSALMMQNVDDMGGDEPIICLQSMRKGKDDLEVILGSLAKLYVMGYPVNWDNFYKDFDVQNISLPPTLEKFYCSNLAHLSEKEMKGDTFWAMLNGADDESTKCQIILRYVFQVMRIVLKSEKVALDPDKEFRAFGIDSLLAIQMKTHLQKVLGSGVSLSFNDLLECYTPQHLVRKLHQLIYTNNNNSKRAEKEEMIKLVKEDSVLWSQIKAHTRRPVALSDIKRFLVTGATGNLAPYVIMELAKRPKTERIYCIVRESQNASAKERLENHLKEEGIWEKVDVSKIIAVKGNIVDEYLGMEKGAYEKLTKDVDAIINCAVTANHLAPYKKENLKYGGVRAVNVIGVQRVLEFAGTARTKWVYHASTFVAIWGKNGVHYDRVPEDWPEVNYTEELNQFPNFGYSISKLISDQLVHQAVQRGIPCKIFRFVKIGGEIETGRQKVMQNHFFLKFLHYIVGGLMPNLEVPLQLMSVNTCAEISARVFFDERANPSDIYNVVVPYAVTELDLVELIEEFGPQLRILAQLSRIVEKIGEDGARKKWLEMSSSGPLANVVAELDRTIGRNWFENPSSAFENDMVMDFIRSQFSFETKIVPYKEYAQHLVEDGEDSLIYHWIDFYTSKDSIFYMADEGTLPLQESWNKNQSHFLRWGKIEMLYPNLHEVVEHPFEALRRDIRYTIKHAKEIFANRYRKQ